MEKSKDKSVNTQLPSLLGGNIVQIMVSGKTAKVKRFWEFIMNSTAYRLMQDSHRGFDVLDRQQNTHVVMQLEENLTTQREEYTIQLETVDGKNINFVLLDAHMIEISDEMTYIHGKSYDIFADPIRRKESSLGE